MYLKQVEMENFKSFGKKLSVPFFQGFTAITGPNGSGKSNIIDAVLFVLGPKSSKVMRAGRLTDLIFNGGKKQKNPAKYCRVSLYFDNKERKMPVDADEVILTRMIKRAPLKDNPDNYYSYFYINDKAASFSDFVDLLNHARISGEGYNIIKQGDVTSLVEMGSIERRRIVDHIAGISSFDDDIKKAEKEKGDVESNLERIDIILHEIVNQTRQLKKERDEAYRYKEIKDKLYETKAKIAYKKKYEIQNQIAEIVKQIESYENERTKLVEKQQEVKKTFDEEKQKLQEIEAQIAEAGGDETQGFKVKITELRTEEIKLVEKINFENDELSELKKEKTDHTENLKGISSELEELQKALDELNTTIEEKQAIVPEKEKAFLLLKESIAQSDDASMDLTRELIKMREEYNEKQTELHELQLKRDRLREKIESLDLKIAEMQEIQSTYTFELKDIDWQCEETQKGKQEIQKQLRHNEKQLVEKKKTESHFTQQLLDFENVIRELQREHAKLQAESEAVASVQGKYNQAVHAILAARDTQELRGIHGTVAELATVDKKFEAALETAAGARMQAIIVDNDETASSAIDYLQKKKLGRATFLPLNKMIVGKPRGNALMAVKDPSSQGFALDLVKYKPAYRGAFWYVFGDTVVTKTLEDARRLMGGVRLVDLKGSLIEASGAMVGGSRPQIGLSFSGADQKKVSEVVEQLNKAIASQDKLTGELTTLKKEITELENTIRSLKNDVDPKFQDENYDVRRKEYTKKLELLTADLNEKIKEKETLEKEHSELVNQINSCETRITEINTVKEEKGKHLLKSTKKEIAQDARKQEQELTQLQDEIRTLLSEKETNAKKISLIEERKNEIVARIETIDQQTETRKAWIDQAKEKRIQIQNELKALLTVEEQMSGKVKQLALKRDTVYKQTVTLENDLDKATTKIESYLDLISRAKYRLPTLEDTIKELDQEIALYQVEITDKNLPNVESLKETMRGIEETMQKLEPVNMRALEEYDHQMERKKKFDEDIKHLTNQKKNLTKLVNEITAKKTERFFEVYDEINANFKRIYAGLSEDGEAELELENEEQLFESGLTIKARPRGKKILRLDALSGGEKSIASIAFIFAVQQYDPSPFYVLDEVDMFLDGVNAETVSRMIKQKAEHSQFITVSLRKIVLKEADYVYGVTMHDEGVSQMIGNIDPESVGPKGEIHTREVSHVHA